MESVLDFLKDSKIISAVRSETELKNCLNCQNKVVFLLFGDLLTIPEYIKELKKHNKTVFVHLDLIDGLSSSKSSIDYINNTTLADGIISIKQVLLKYAKTLGFKTVLRFFMLDSKSIDSLEKINNDSSIDIIELMPGIVVTLLGDVVKKIQKPIIGGGLIRSKEVAQKILDAGATAVSTSDLDLWG